MRPRDHGFSERSWQIMYVIQPTKGFSKDYKELIECGWGFTPTRLITNIDFNAMFVWAFLGIVSFAKVSDFNCHVQFHLHIVALAPRSFSSRCTIQIYRKINGSECAEIVVMSWDETRPIYWRLSWLICMETLWLYRHNIADFPSFFLF